MRHRVAGRKLGRTTAHRVALLRNLSTSLFEQERITTTLAKAKELRPFAEKLITLCKKETLHSRRLVLRHIHDRKVVGKMFDTISARFAQRPGGYTRIIKIGPRRGDNAEMAIIELVEAQVKEAKGETAKPKKTAKKKKVAKKTAKAKATKTAEKKKEAGEKAAPKKKTAKKKAAKKAAKKTSAEEKPKTAKKKTARRKKKSDEGGGK